MKRLVALLMVFVMCGVCFCSCTSSTSDNNIDSSNYYEYEDNADTYENEATEPATQSEDIDKSVITKVKMTIKDYGEIELDLYDKEAPITVDNFKKLVNEGFYNGLTFHRIIRGFMIQGGDPQGTGTGGSDEEIKGEFSSNGVENNISHIRGVISMARSSDPNSASSQFFICDATSPHLDGEYAAFGEVTSGMDVVDKIAADAQPVDGNGSIDASQQPVIEKIEVIG